MFLMLGLSAIFAGAGTTAPANTSEVEVYFRLAGNNTADPILAENEYLVIDQHTSIPPDWSLYSGTPETLRHTFKVVGYDAETDEALLISVTGKLYRLRPNVRYAMPIVKIVRTPWGDHRYAGNVPFIRFLRSEGGKFWFHIPQEAIALLAP